MNDQMISFARLVAGVSQSELAALANMPASTVSRIERGLVSPSIDTLNRLLGALGQRLAGTTVPRVDLSAIAACRTVLDPDTEIPCVEGSDLWIQAWTRAGLIATDGTAIDAGRICQMAGINTMLRARPSRSIGAIAPDVLAERLSDAGIGYALTGSAAANRIRMVGTESWTVSYVEDVDAAANMFGDPLADNAESSLLLPFDSVTSIGATAGPDRVNIVDPVQVVIDLYAGIDRMPDQADILAAWFDDQVTVGV